MKKGKSKIIKTAHFKTDSSTLQAIRYAEIEAFTLLFIRDNKPFDKVIREIWPPSRNYAQNNKIHGAWASVERALSRYGYEVNDNLTPSNVKKTVTGNGNATKGEVAEAVRKWTGYKGEFATDDESDACGVAIAYGIQAKLIKE